MNLNDVRSKEAPIRVIDSDTPYLSHWHTAPVRQSLRCDGPDCPMCKAELPTKSKTAIMAVEKAPREVKRRSWMSDSYVRATNKKWRRRFEAGEARFTVHRTPVVLTMYESLLDALKGGFRRGELALFAVGSSRRPGRLTDEVILVAKTTEPSPEQKLILNLSKQRLPAEGTYEYNADRTELLLAPEEPLKLMASYDSEQQGKTHDSDS